MITKLALLSRLVPELFRRLPTVTSVGYRMPHKRYFLAGISFSAALHAAVLFGIRPPVVVPPPVEISMADPLGGLVFAPVAEEPPPPPPEDGDKSKSDDAKPSEAGEDTSRIPEPTRPSITPGGITFDPPSDVGKLPGTGPLRWEAPKKTGPGLNGKNAKIINEKDLDVRPVATSRISPRYPFDLKRAGVSGTAVLRFVVDNRGNVSEVEVVSADHPEFGRTAAEAMLRWKFKAGMKDGLRVNTRMEMPMTFALNSDT